MIQFDKVVCDVISIVKEDLHVESGSESLESTFWPKISFLMAKLGRIVVFRLFVLLSILELLLFCQLRSSLVLLLDLLSILSSNYFKKCPIFRDTTERHLFQIYIQDLKLCKLNQVKQETVSKTLLTICHDTAFLADKLGFLWFQGLSSVDSCLP